MTVQWHQGSEVDTGYRHGGNIGLDPNQGLSPRQANAIDGVMRTYTAFADDARLAVNRERRLS
jgi:hypothetical protein